MPRLARLAAALALVTLAACSQQGPAEQAVDAAESALAAVHEDAVKYVPDEYKAVKAELDRAREALKAGGYAEALSIVAAVPGKAEALAQHATEAKQKLADRLQGEWQDLAGAVPGMVGAAEARLAELAGKAKLPAGMNKAMVDELSGALTAAKQTWATAQEKFAAGDFEQAVANAMSTRTQAQKLLVALGLAPAEPAAEAAAPAPAAAN